MAGRASTEKAGEGLEPIGNMPTRLLREEILTSPRVEQLDFPAEVFYRRLMSKVDDHGLFDARPSILRATLFPLRVDRVREADISRWIAICEKAGLIVLYNSSGKDCLKMLDTRWQVRSEPKYPLPTVNNCKQPETPVHLDVVVNEVNTPAKKQPESECFERFWKAYPRKKNKGHALNAWKKGKLDHLLEQILLSLNWQVKSNEWRKDGGQFIPHPATYLNAKGWLDEPTSRPNVTIIKGSDGKDYERPDVSL